MAIKSRGAIDNVLPNMFSNDTYSKTYLFYAHMIGMCSIVINDKMPAPAGVSFHNDHYKLHINPNVFDNHKLEEQLAILKHEMEHILNDHVHRQEDRIHLPWNYATDCAINQLIERSHLPSGAILPSNFPTKVKENETSEQYYDALKAQSEKDKKDDKSKEQESECGDCDGTGHIEDKNGESETCSRCGGTGKDSSQGSYGDEYGQLIDDHGTWNKSQGEEVIQKLATSDMIQKAISETNKSRGNLPNNISDYVSLFANKPQLMWKKILKNIVGNKKVNSRRTIMRSDRRFPKREDLRGRTKDRMFELTIVVDVSGSMSNEEIMMGLTEIHHICKMSHTTMKLIQVDTEVHNVEEFSEKTKLFERSGQGGTIMYPAIEYIKEHKIATDACILITDGYIEDVSEWEELPKYRMMFLCTTPNHTIPGVASINRFQQFDLSIKDAS